MNWSRERALCCEVTHAHCNHQSEPRSAFGAGDGILAKRQTAPIANASTNPRINLISVSLQRCPFSPLIRD